MRRRRALQVAGGLLTGGLAGCTAGGQVFRTYRYVKDAPIDGPVALPRPTLGYDARRTGYTPHGGLPSETAVSLFALAGQPIKMQPAFINEGVLRIDGVAYFGAKTYNDGLRRSGLRAADSQGDGWFVPETDELASPTIVGDAIFVTSDGMTRALDRRDGTLCWAYHEGASYPTASPTVVDDTVYVTGDRVFALSATMGEVQWATNRSAGLRGTAATEDGVFATASGEVRGTVYRFEPETGREQWATSTRSEILVPPVLGEFVYVVEANGRIRALDRVDGSEAWSQELGSRSTAMPAVAEGTVYAVGVDSNTTTLKALDARTGTVRWQTIFTAQSATGPTIAGDTVYFPMGVENGGLINELAADTGEIRGSHELPQAPVTPLIVGVAMGFISTGTSPETRLYLLKRPDPSALSV